MFHLPEIAIFLVVYSRTRTEKPSESNENAVDKADRYGNTHVYRRPSRTCLRLSLTNISFSVIK